MKWFFPNCCHKDEITLLSENSVSSFSSAFMLYCANVDIITTHVVVIKMLVPCIVEKQALKYTSSPESVSSGVKFKRYTTMSPGSFVACHSSQPYQIKTIELKRSEQ